MKRGKEKVKSDKVSAICIMECGMLIVKQKIIKGYVIRNLKPASKSRSSVVDVFARINSVEGVLRKGIAEVLSRDFTIL